MTIEEKLSQMLIESGLFEAQAAQVLERVKAAEINKPMVGRWETAIEDYPPFFLVFYGSTSKSIPLPGLMKIAQRLGSAPSSQAKPDRSFYFSLWGLSKVRWQN